MASSFYSEEQRFSESPLIYIFLFAAIAGLGGMGFVLYSERNSEEDLMIAAIATAFMVIIFFVIGWGLFNLRLETKIQGTTISFKMPPLINKKKEIKASEIQTAEVITYKPIGQYGGYGYRYSPRHGKAYNIRGNKGLKIHLTSGKDILIGTQKPELLKMAVQKMMDNRVEDYG